MDRQLTLHLELSEAEAALLLGLLIERAALADALQRDAFIRLPEDWVNFWQSLADRAAAAILAARADAPESGVAGGLDS